MEKDQTLAERRQWKEGKIPVKINIRNDTGYRHTIKICIKEKINVRSNIRSARIHKCIHLAAVLHLDSCLDVCALFFFYSSLIPSVNITFSPSFDKLISIQSWVDEAQPSPC